MPDIKLYDYQRQPAPEGTKITCYWTPPPKYSSTAHAIAPWVDAPLICGFYDEKNNLIGTRIIRRDGTWEDVSENINWRERTALLVEKMGIEGYGTLAIAAAIRKGEM